MALHRVRQNKRWEKGRTDARAPGSPFSRLEDHDALRRAWESLDPVDETILRMKYYEGKTAREIAESLGLPYETVKKRHQRGLKKLLRALLTTLLILAALTVLAACAYLVLRYFGFVPRYGVNRNPEEAVYVLQESAVIEDGPYTFRLEDAWWREGALFVDMTYTTSDSGGNSGSMMMSSGAHAFSASLEGLEGAGRGSVAQGSPSPYGETPLRLIFEGDLPPDAGGALTLTLTLDGTEIPLTLETAEESTLSESGAYSLAPDGQRPAGRSPPRARQPHRLRLPAGRRRVLHPALAHARRVGRLRRAGSARHRHVGGRLRPHGRDRSPTRRSAALPTRSGTSAPPNRGTMCWTSPMSTRTRRRARSPSRSHSHCRRRKCSPVSRSNCPAACGRWNASSPWKTPPPTCPPRPPGRMAPARAGGAVACSWESEDPARTMAAIPVQAESQPVEADGVSYPGVSIQLWTETVTQDGRLRHGAARLPDLRPWGSAGGHGERSCPKASATAGTMLSRWR